MRNQHLIFVCAVSMLFLTPVLMGCQATSLDVAGSTTDPPEESETLSAPTELPAPVPTARQTATPAATETSTEEATNSSESEQKANADVEFVRAVQKSDGSWTFHVTVRHPDTGWEDYADGWDVTLPDGSVIKRGPEDPFTRLLLHPHESEQPFTRSQGNLLIPDNISLVTVRAHDLVDGFGGKEIVIDLAVSAGHGFEVER